MISTRLSAVMLPYRTIGPYITTRSASLSAIHRGLRRSERAQHGAPRSRSPPSRLTDRALGGASSDRQRSKLRKKLSRKEEEEADEDSGRQTRRKRFTDPSSDFGKGSLVYELKHGAFKDRLETFQRDKRAELKSYQVDRRSSSNFGSRRTQDSRDNGRDSNRDGGSWASNFASRRERPEYTDKSPTKRYQSSSTPRDNPRQRDDMTSTMRQARRTESAPPTTTIKYSTAASQFLYGKAVVKSALEQERRKLYRLYIQTGENRSDDQTLTRLAERKGVTIQRVPSSEQHVMDKISMGRPHNGYILEASPLPQPPVTGLGAVEQSPGRNGFHISLGHQTKEELDVNGSDTFVRRSSGKFTSKPFVLLLHEIMDPGNLGGILRTASYLGVDAVGITSRSSSSLTPVVLKSAAGAVEEIPIFRVDSPVAFLEASKQAGWRTYGAVAPPERKLAERHDGKFVSLNDVEASQPLRDSPCILVMGNEGHGLPKAVKVATDLELSVPRFVTSSCVDSLNVSVATGVLCHAFVRSATRDYKAPVPEAVTEESNESVSAEGEKMF